MCWDRSAPAGSPGAGGRWVGVVGGSEGLFLVVARPGAVNRKSCPCVPVTRSKEFRISRYVERGGNTQKHLANMREACTGRESLVLQVFINIK